MSALDGLRVLEVADGIACATAGMMLGDLGAEVIKVQTQSTKRWSTQAGELSWNRNKQLLPVGPGDAAVGRLLQGADIVLVDAGHAELAARGLDVGSTARANPSTVHCWLPAGGAVGQWRDLPPDPVLQAAVVGACWRADRPRLLHEPVVAYQQGVQAATAAMASVLGRERRGAVSPVVVSGLHAFTALHVATLVFGLERDGLRGGWPNYRLYVDKDGLPFALCSLANHFFIRALEVLDLTDVFLVPGYDGVYEHLALPEVGDAVAARLGERFVTAPREHWVSILREAGVPAAVVASPAEWLESDLIVDSGMRVTIHDPEVGDVLMPGVALSMSATPPEPPRLARRGEPRWSSSPVAADDRRAVHGGDGNGPLAGLSVLDLGTFIAGPYGPMVLASMGADVVKVEALDGDPYRAVALAFFAVNRGKRSVALDLKSEQGHRDLLRLVRRSDVVMENFRPGVAQRLGITGGVLLAENPRLVHTSVTAWGSDGDMAEMAGFDMMVSAMSGMTYSGTDVGLVHDIGTPTLAVLGTLAALFDERRRGVGQLVSTSMARHSLMAQLGDATSGAGRASRLDVGTLEERSDGWWVVTPQGEAKVLCQADVKDDAWVAANGTWSEVTHAAFGPMRAVREFAAWSPPSVYGTTTPGLGEDAALLLHAVGSEPPPGDHDG